MDCKIFRKRLTDLIEDNISYDLKDAMLEHLTECEVCRALYEEELSIDETIKRGLSIDPRFFNSSRADIMKSIDKNKYGTSLIKKLMNHLSKYKGTYTSVAAVIVAAIFITPYIGRTGISFGAKKSASFENANSLVKSIAENARGTADLKIEAPQAQAKREGTGAAQDSSLLIKSAEVETYNPSFEKKPLDRQYKPSYSTVWEYSESKKISAAVEGRGEASQDEGVATIIVKNEETGEQWAFNLLGNEMQQKTSKFVRWIDDENLLVIVGLAQGHASLGGHLYMLNINSLETTNADPENKANLQNGSEIMKIAATKILPNNQLEITVEVSVYDDDIQNKYHVENRTIVMTFSK
jgi:hypothetical protein